MTVPPVSRVAARRVRACLAAGLVAACGGVPPLSLCLPPDGRFELRYVHSVERTDVVERYRLVGSDLWLEGMRFRSLGWGLPAQGFVRRGGWFETTDPPRPVDGLVLRVSHVARPEVVAGGQTLALYRVLPDGAAVRVEGASSPDCPRRLVLRRVP